MKKISKKNQAFLEKLMAEYNDYSELVALNYHHKKIGKCEDSTLQWNRGHLYCVEELLKDFAGTLKVTLVFVPGTHPFLEYSLDYCTVHLEGEDTTYHRTKMCEYQIR